MTAVSVQQQKACGLLQRWSAGRTASWPGRLQPPSLLAELQESEVEVQHCLMVEQWEPEGNAPLPLSRTDK
eukprot:24428-Rhodomonas_salina.1